VVGRAKTFEAIVKGTEIPQALVPESFRVLIKELNSLGLEVITTGAVEAGSAAAAQPKITEEDLKHEKAIQQEVVQLAQAAGAKVVAEE